MQQSTTLAVTIRPEIWSQIVRRRIPATQSTRRRVALLVGRDAESAPEWAEDLGQVEIPESTYKRLRISRREFYRHLAALVDDGYLERCQAAGRNHPAVYRLALPTAATATRARDSLVVVRVRIPDSPAALLERTAA